MSPHLKDDTTIVIEIDPAFTGMMHGYANDEAEGCIVKGNCIVNVHHTIKVRRLVVWLEGRCKVHLKASTYGVSATEAIETRSLYSRNAQFIGEDGQTHVMAPGQYTYPFEFELPSNLPASFRGKYGYIRYRLASAIYKAGMFSSDIQIYKDINIKRCLLADLTSTPDMFETVQGYRHLNKLQRYNATAPRIAYREGGLVRLNVAMQVTNPATQSVQSVTCALREQVQYRTTSSNGRTAHNKTNDRYPLGYSSFHPNQSEDYDPSKSQEYNAVFRLIPRVHADTNSRLLRVTHSLVVNILVHDKDGSNTASDTGNDSSSDHEENGSSFANDSSSEDNHDEKFEHPSPLSTPPSSRPPSPSHRPSTPTLSRSSSSSSLASIFSLRHTSNHENKHRSAQSDLTLCTLEIPLIVTSRDNASDGDFPKPPTYESTNIPPSYDKSLEVLPRVPNYACEDDTPEAVNTSTTTPTLSSPVS